MTTYDYGLIGETIANPNGTQNALPSTEGLIETVRFLTEVCDAELERQDSFMAANELTGATEVEYQAAVDRLEKAVSNWNRLAIAGYRAIRTAKAEATPCPPA